MCDIPRCSFYAAVSFVILSEIFHFSILEEQVLWGGGSLRKQALTWSVYMSEE